MSNDPMEIDSTKQKAGALQSLITGPLQSSVAKLSGSSRGIPYEKDFHFYYNFDAFKVPIKNIADSSQSVLDKVGSSVPLWGKEMLFPEDMDDAYDWLVNVNDEVLDRFDVSVDEFRSLRKKEEDTGVRLMSSVSGDLDHGFQLVSGKKKKVAARDVDEDLSSASTVKIASRDKRTMGITKPKVPFHIPTIPRPQDEYKILVNNSNQPFDHVWLQKSEEDSRFIHPLEKLSVLDFVDCVAEDLESKKPPPIECTPFKLVEEVKDLKELAAKLWEVDEFAVDLEHNQYRSFQGLTCLMQISTRTEDFVVDTLKLRIQIGPYLRELFKDPKRKKVMHGADRDILWLQRDFGIYVCNMFDTGQASRVLKLERNSLEYLLHHFCGVAANKEYQNADWRLRPLPNEMLRYAREDTHYLLHIYDLMKMKLLSLSTGGESSDTPLVEVYRRSYDICMQLYEKEILTDNSYLYIYGLQDANLNAQQLAIVAGLCEWRDVVARAEDESTGYILPNKTLLEIAKQVPVTASKLRRVMKSKHPYVDRNLNYVVNIIRRSMQNAAAFEAAVYHLKEGRSEIASEENVLPDVSEKLSPEATVLLKTQAVEECHNGNESVYGDSRGQLPTSMLVKEKPFGPRTNTTVFDRIQQECCSVQPTEEGDLKSESEKRTEDSNGNVSRSGSGATVKVLKKPSRGFGMLLGNAATKRKFDPDKMEKEQIKLEQIKSSVNLKFHSFVGQNDNVEPVHEASVLLRNPHQEVVTELATTLKPVDIILLEVDSSDEKCLNGSPEAENDQVEERENHAKGALEINGANDTVSLSDLSSSFQKCFKSINQTQNGNKTENSPASSGPLQLTPFDYEAARNQVRFGEDTGGVMGSDDGDNSRSRSDRKKCLDKGQSTQSQNEGTREFQQGRRRQAFPASGNRSATFRQV